MTLKTSSRKINPFWNMITFTLRKNIGAIIVLCIAALVYYPGTFIINYENLFTSVQNSTRSYMVENFGNAITVLSAIVAVLFNMLNFNFLYKKSSSDVFHAFPLKRSELLLSRFIAGIVSTLIPSLICYSAFGILMAFNSWMGSFTELLYYLLHTVIILLVCSSFSMIFVVSAGSSFDLGVSLIGGNLALLAVGAIFESILDDTLVGYYGHSSSEIMYNLSPPYLCGVGLGLVNEVNEKGITAQSIDFLIRSVIYIVAFTVISLLLYNRRKAEKGETAYAYKFMYLGCSLLAGICGGYVLGTMFESNVTNFAFWFFAVIGCLLTTVIYGAVTNRGFKGVSKSIIMGVISAVALISVTVIGVTGGFGYTNRVPDKNQIKNVTVTTFDESIVFEDPQQVLDLHHAILDTGATDYDEAIYYDDYNGITQEVTTRYISIFYELNNGKTLSRSFHFDVSKASDELLAVYKSNERLKMIKKEISDTATDEIVLYFYYNEDHYNVTISETELQEFLGAYWQDVQNCDSSVFKDYDYDTLEISGYKYSGSYRQSHFSFSLENHDNFVNTKNFISEHNLIERSKEYTDQAIKN